MGSQMSMFPVGHACVLYASRMGLPWSQLGTLPCATALVLVSSWDSDTCRGHVSLPGMRCLWCVASGVGIGCICGVHFIFVCLTEEAVGPEEGGGAPT
jgi:hypothetical protein